jgi:succinate-acetate transporter protein
MILAMGLAYGGLAQVIVGIMEYKKGNTFGTTAFTSYGLFWWSLVFLLVLPQTSLFTGLSAPTETAMATYFFMWGAVYFCDVLWNTEDKPCTAIRAYEFGNSILPSCGKRVDIKYGTVWIYHSKYDNWH